MSRSGAWFKLGDEQLGQGKENVLDRLMNEPELLARIAEACRTAAPREVV